MSGYLSSFFHCFQHVPILIIFFIVGMDEYIFLTTYAVNGSVIVVVLYHLVLLGFLVSYARAILNSSAQKDFPQPEYVC